MMFDDPHCGDHVFRTENSTTKQTISDISDNQFCEFLRAKHWRTRCVPFLTLVFIRHAQTTSAHQNAKHFDGWTTDSSNKLNDIQWHYTGFSMAQQGSPCLTPSFPRKKNVSLSCRSLLPSKVDHWRRSGDMENLLEMCGISAAFAATFAENMWSFLGFCWRQMGDLSNKKPRIMWVKQSYNKPSRSHHLIGGICLPFPGKWLVYLRHCFTHKNGIDQQRWPARLRSDPPWNWGISPTELGGFSPWYTDVYSNQCESVSLRFSASVILGGNRQKGPSP